MAITIIAGRATLELYPRWRLPVDVERASAVFAALFVAHDNVISVSVRHDGVVEVDLVIFADGSSDLPGIRDALKNVVEEVMRNS